MKNTGEPPEMEPAAEEPRDEAGRSEAHSMRRIQWLILGIGIAVLVTALVVRVIFR